MKAGTHLAWLQLVKQKGHFAAALAGVAFAVTLMLGQIGLRDSLLATGVRLYSHLRGDIVMTSWQYQFEQGAAFIPQRRFPQAGAVEGVESCLPVRIGWLPLRNPIDHQQHQIVLIGLNPFDEVLDFGSPKPDFAALTRPGSLLFDADSRSMFGPLAERFRAGGPFDIEAAGRQARIVGLVGLGPGFGTDGHIFTSDVSFGDFVAGASSSLPSLGMIRLKPGADPETVLRRLRASLPSDVHFSTMPEFLDNEQQYWLKTSPIGFVFTAGLLIGIVVGSVVVYQILYSDVTNHLAEYATMKAMGFRDRQLFLLVIRQAVFMSILGFLPGALMAKAIFVVTHNATLLPLDMTAHRLIQVYILTLTMCGVSGALGMLALNGADPAEIF
jgi:putative ABC transport system permease protein